MRELWFTAQAKLHHEVGHDPKEAAAVVNTSLHEPPEVRRAQRRPAGVYLRCAHAHGHALGGRTPRYCGLTTRAVGEVMARYLHS